MAGAVAVIGAGPAGLTAALQITRAGHAVKVFEASSHVGGLARSFELWGQIVDVGPHRFYSQDSRVNKFWLEIIGRDYAMVNRLTRIYYKGRFFSYPLKPLNALANLGPTEALRCMLSYIREKNRSRKVSVENASFEEWVVSRFGRRLFEIFFKSYSEKLWGIPCQELDADFAAQRIRKLSLSGAVRNAIFPYREKHRTLVDRFAYPLNGTGEVYSRISRLIQTNGGEVFTSTPIQKLFRSDDKIIGLMTADGRVHDCAAVVSTMPLTHLVRGMQDVPDEVQLAAQQLQFRNTTLVYLRVAVDYVFPDQWLYIHSPELGFGRVTNFSNWVPSIRRDSKDTILCLEYWSQEDGFWKMSETDLIQLAIREISSTGLVEADRVTAGHVVRVPRCYPIYRRGYKSLVRVIADWLRSFSNLHVIGRYGAFKYNNQDHSILMGLLAAENILLNQRHDLWGVNSDYENYLESSRITETGLEKI